MKNNNHFTYFKEGYIENFEVSFKSRNKHYEEQRLIICSSLNDKLYIMKTIKKLFYLITILFILIYTISCNNESISNTDVDYSILKKSKLKYLVKNTEIINDKNLNTHNKTAIPLQCRADAVLEKTSQSYSNYGLSVIETFITETHSFRDIKLEIGETGITYKDVYYYLSSVLKDEEISYFDVTKLITIIPTVKNIYDRIADDNYNAIIINNTERNEIIEFLDYYSLKLNADIDIEIINAIKVDLFNLTNRNLEQIEGFLSE